MPVITVITQTDNPAAAEAVTATADAWGCLSVVIQDGLVTRPVARGSEDE